MRKIVHRAPQKKYDSNNIPVSAEMSLNATTTNTSLPYIHCHIKQLQRKQQETEHTAIMEHRIFPTPYR